METLCRVATDQAVAPSAVVQSAVMQSVAPADRAVERPARASLRRNLDAVVRSLAFARAGLGD
jgi:hypothetical protein